MPSSWAPVCKRLRPAPCLPIDQLSFFPFSFIAFSSLFELLSCKFNCELMCCTTRLKLCFAHLEATTYYLLASLSGCRSPRCTYDIIIISMCRHQTSLCHIKHFRFRREHTQTRYCHLELLGMHSANSRFVDSFKKVWTKKNGIMLLLRRSLFLVLNVLPQKLVCSHGFHFCSQGY